MTVKKSEKVSGYIHALSICIGKSCGLVTDRGRGSATMSNEEFDSWFGARDWQTITICSKY
ncbi:hypothetical protein ACHAWO_011219 [Cyclotella atomus]|uniref:Uncharacterized protein n=1 Tax=Cyclotella atomus TaxID=382360 RepID=A0ABD3NVT3_9STRA